MTGISLQLKSVICVFNATMMCCYLTIEFRVHWEILWCEAKMWFQFPSI